MTTTLKTEKLRHLKALIKQDATRERLLAYTVLRNRDLAKCESPFTRTEFSVRRVMGIVEEHYEPLDGIDTDAALEAFEDKLSAWNGYAIKNRDYVHANGVRGLHERMLKEAA
jgi:hypothetical protein